MPQVKPDVETFAKIRVVGVGGSGGAAVDRMVKSGIRGVEFMAMNTDVQALHHNSAAHKLHIGKTVTRGLGAGMDPEMGKRSAEEAQNEIREALKDTDMVFITCGLGGGTGSGAAPVIAQIAKELGALTVGVVTKPFTFEGPQRGTIADTAHQDLSRYVDAIITIPNDRVLQIIDKKTSLLDAFKIVDDVLHQGVRGISEIITVPALINVDFADVKTIMQNTGSALMGIGVGTGENRAVDAAKAAISSPLLEISIDGARGILFTITGGSDLGMQEVSEAAKVITSSADDDVKVIFGAVIDENMTDEVRVTVIATGFEDRSRSGVLHGVSDDEIPSLFGRTKSFYTPTSFKKKEYTMPTVTTSTQNEEEDAVETDRGFFTKNVAPRSTRSRSSSVFSAGRQDTQITDMSSDADTPVFPRKSGGEEEDLEIPAFIRKKMGM